MENATRTRAKNPDTKIDRGRRKKRRSAAHISSRDFFSARLGTDIDAAPARQSARGGPSTHFTSARVLKCIKSGPVHGASARRKHSAQRECSSRAEGGMVAQHGRGCCRRAARTRLQIVDRLLAHHFRRSDRHEAALQAQHAPRAKSNRNEALHRDLREHMAKRRVGSLGRVASGAAPRDALTANGE